MAKHGDEASGPVRAAQPQSVRVTPPQSNPDQVEASEGAVHEILGGAAFPGVIVDKLKVQVTADVEVTQGVSSAVAAAFVKALERYWQFYSRMSKVKGRDLAGVAGGDFLFSVLPDLSQGIESGNIHIRATPSSSRNAGGVTFLYRSEMVEVRLGAQEWDIVLLIKEAAVEPSVWRTYAATRGVGR